MNNNNNNNNPPNDKNDQSSKKKNPAPAPRSVKRRRKKGPAVAVKIPQGNTILVVALIERSSYAHSFSHCKMQVKTFEIGKNQGLSFDGTGVHSESGN